MCLGFFNKSNLFNILKTFLLFIFSKYCLIPARVYGHDQFALRYGRELEIESNPKPITVRESLFSYKINDLSVATRYRIQQNAAGDLSNNQLQLRLNMDVNLLFFKDHVQIDFQGATGQTFGSLWSSTGIGDHANDFEFNFRRLALTLKPSDHFEFKTGSMAPVFGAGTDNTYIDADGYIMGYRARIKYEPTEIVVTGGYLGDYAQPNVFHRFNELDDVTYFQVLLQQRLSEIVKASIDYSYFGKSDDIYQPMNMARGAVMLNLSQWTPIVDLVTTEYSHGFHPGAEHDLNLFALESIKKLKKVEALGNRDVVIGLNYLYHSDNLKDIPFPIEDKGFKGSSYRINFSLLNLLNDAGPGRWSATLDWLQSLTDCKQWRCEVALGWKF